MAEEPIGLAAAANGGDRLAGPGVPDNSNTQFALLGVWAAGRHGFDSDAALAALDDHFRGDRQPRRRLGLPPGRRVEPTR